MTEPLVIEYAPGVSVDITKALAEGRPVVVIGGGGGGGKGPEPASPDTNAGANRVRVQEGGE